MILKFPFFFILFLLPVFGMNQSMLRGKMNTMPIGCLFEIAAPAERNTEAWTAINAGMAAIERIEISENKNWFLPKSYRN
jgi:hypothetical protein